MEGHVQSPAPMINVINEQVQMDGNPRHDDDSRTRAESTTLVNCNQQGMIQVNINRSREGKNSSNRSGKRIRMELGESSNTKETGAQVEKDKNCSNLLDFVNNLNLGQENPLLNSMIGWEGGIDLNMLKTYLTMGEFDVFLISAIMRI